MPTINVRPLGLRTRLIFGSDRVRVTARRDPIPITTARDKCAAAYLTMGNDFPKKRRVRIITRRPSSVARLATGPSFRGRTKIHSTRGSRDHPVSMGRYIYRAWVTDLPCDHRFSFCGPHLLRLKRPRRHENVGAADFWQSAGRSGALPVSEPLASTPSLGLFDQPQGTGPQYVIFLTLAPGLP
jgi:hypothetical protein